MGATLKNEIGSALKRLRVEKGLTQKELAAKVSDGLDYTYIGKIERGEQLPSLKILNKISEALSVHVSFFFQETGVSGDSRQAPPRLAEARQESELFRELKQLHRDDVPLLTEIVRALNRHRKLGRKKAYAAAPDSLPIAAEDGPTYDEK